MTENQISRFIFNSALKVHRALGPGLLENSYQECLYYELNKQGLYVQKEVIMPLFYEEVELDIGYRIDLLVEKKVVIEVKSVKALDDVHMAQMITYLKLSGCKLGMLMNFHVALIKGGVKRVVNNL